MKDNVEKLLESVMPRGAAPELRSRVLESVAGELSHEVSCRWERRVGMLVAASFLLGLVWNLWAVQSTQQMFVEITGPRPESRRVTEIVETIESVTGSGTGDWVQASLSKERSGRPRSSPLSMLDMEQLLIDLELTGKVQPREKAKEIPDQRQHRPGRAARDSYDSERDSYLRLQRTA